MMYLCVEYIFVQIPHQTVAQYWSNPLSLILFYLAVAAALN